MLYLIERPAAGALAAAACLEDLVKVEAADCTGPALGGTNAVALARRSEDTSADFMTARRGSTRALRAHASAGSPEM
jgi:hypothetical protein